MIQNRQGHRLAGSSQLQRDVILGGSGAMFGGEGQSIAAAAHIKI